MLMDLCCVAFQVFVKQKDKEYQSVCSKGKKTMINRVTYLVETGETPLLLCGVWTLVLMVAGEKDVVDDGKIKKDEGCCGVPVDGGRLLDRGIVDG